ncbi:MAG TPA: DUF58 domain-containing protein [Thermoplasmata archaeon]
MRTESLGTVLIVASIVFAVAGILFEKLPFVIGACVFSSIMVYSRLRMVSEIEATKLEVARMPGEGIAFATEPIQIFLRISNYGPVPVRAAFEDVLPAGCHLGRGTNSFDRTLPPRSGISISYTIVPEKRGNYSFEGLKVRRRDLYGLFSDETTFPVRTDINVHTAKESLQAARKLAGREHFEYYGVSRTPSIVMHDLEFDSIREYSPGDKARDIHWKLLSKLDRLMTKVYTKEGAIQTRVLLDCSRSMRQASGAVSKLDHGVDLSLQLSKVLLSSFHAAGVTLVDETSVIAEVPPSLAKGQFEKIVLALKQTPPSMRSPAGAELAEKAAPQGGRGKSVVTDKTPEGEAMLSSVQSLGTSLPRQVLGIEGIVKASLTRAKGQKKLFIVISDMMSSRDAILTAASVCERSGNRMIVLHTYDDWYNQGSGPIDAEEAERLYENMTKSIEVEAKFDGLRVGYLRVGPADTTGGIVRMLRRQSA